jgi:uncharacterized membrane protein YphA (DoxX/SURF4 family)
MVQRIIDTFSRFFVGGLFIFSGLIKLNDPVGTQIKLEEYFEVFAVDFGSFFQVFIPYAMELGMILIVLEIVLGVAVLINYRMPVTTWVLLVLIVFFTFLTFYSAYFNKVTDCGCFGDAIKLTPWESFYKDVVLIVFILHLFWYRKTYVPVLYTREGQGVILGVTALSFFLGVYAVRHLPFIDFRAYAIDNNIPEQMQLPPDAKRDSVVMTFIYQKGEAKVELTMDQLQTIDSTYTFVDRVDKVVRVGDRPKITDYAVTDVHGNTVTGMTFQGAKLLIIIEQVAHASTNPMEELRTLIRNVEDQVDVLALTASSETEFEAFRHEHQLAIPYYFADATVLKTMVRANPGLTLWVNGTVKGMWHHNDIPDATVVLNLIKTP